MMDAQTARWLADSVGRANETMPRLVRELAEATQQLQYSVENLGRQVDDLREQVDRLERERAR